MTVNLFLCSATGNVTSSQSSGSIAQIWPSLEGLLLPGGRSALAIENVAFHKWLMSAQPSPKRTAKSSSVPPSSSSIFSRMIPLGHQ
jgi:hypothetical protein